MTFKFTLFMLLKSGIKFILIAGVIIFYSCSNKENVNENEVIIKGKILNPPRDFIEIRERDNPEAKTDTLKLSDKGEFKAKLNPDTLKVYKIVYGTGSKSDTLQTSESAKSNLIISNKTQEIFLMLDKGFELGLTFDAENPQSTLMITGNGSELNNFFSKKTIINNEFNFNFAKLIKSDSDTYFSAVDNYKNSVESLIKGLPSDSKYIPVGFKEEEMKNLDYNYYRLKINYAKANLPAEGKESKFNPDENYFNFISNIPFDKKEEMNNKSYIQLVNSYIDYLMKKDAGKSGQASTDAMSNKYSKINELFKNPELRDMMLYDFLKRNSKQIDQQWYKNAIDDFSKNAVNDSLKKEILRLKETRERLSKGNIAPDFTYPDINGKNISLSDFRGKYVYIDVWATWCKPCLYEVPFLKTMEEDYTGRNIVFMSVSIDEDTAKWRTMVNEKKMKGVQLYTSTPETKIMKDFLIGGIPRFIFIGPGGEIIMEDAPRPSNPETRELFETFSGL